MGASASITRNVVKNRNEYMTALFNLKGDTLKVNNDLIDLWAKIQDREIYTGMPPAYYDYALNWMTRTYVPTIKEMDAVIVSFQMKNYAMLETMKDRQSEHYWAKYLRNCRKNCEQIDDLNARLKDIEVRLKDYIRQCRVYKKTCPDDTVELARLTKIQKQINKDAISLRFDKKYFCETFRVVDIDANKINAGVASYV